ncbi:META domain-containing protein [Spirosoma taeanense]|uniref:META domain-containing protein n=1 Tax=Spirosoma taeanense TaxID=2735870 RepID=A0A6M5YBD2_9BACT|nr:META domain-containing protein [Spirosoma taeanense]QJW91249.1 META domain-containing protein [Spirosoma taeanense]
MRFLLFGLLLFVTACRRPSRQLAATLTPLNKPTEATTQTPTPSLPDFSRNLRAGDELVALGNDPDWSMTINPTQGLRFKSFNGDSVLSNVPQRLNDSDGSFRFNVDLSDSAGRIRVLFRPDSCVDNASGYRFDYRVEVDVHGKSYLGCGVSLRQITLLQDTWVLTSFQNHTVTAGGPRNELPRLEISLTNQRVTGTTGCNRLSGKVQSDSRQIRFGPLVTTKMACAGETGRFEGDFLEALSQPLTYRVGEGNLILLQDGKPLMTFRKTD